MFFLLFLFCLCTFCFRFVLVALQKEISLDQNNQFNEPRFVLKLGTDAPRVFFFFLPFENCWF